MWFFGARSVFPSCWVLSAIFFVFPQCFSSLQVVLQRCRWFCDLPLFFCLFLRRFGLHASQHGEQHLGFAWPVISEWWIRSFNHIKFHLFVILYLVALFGRNLSRDCLRPSPRLFSSLFLRCWRPFRRTECQRLLPAASQAILARPLLRPACRQLIHRLWLHVVHHLQQVAWLCLHFFLLIHLLVFLWFLLLLSHPSRRCRHHPCLIIYWYRWPAAWPGRLQSEKHL